MQKYKVVVLKGGKHFTFIVNANNENQVKEKIHKDGYSILHFENISDDLGNNSTQGHKFIFIAEKEGEKKSGRVIGEDIFKVYIKLRKNLGYRVLELFSEVDKDLGIKEKNDIIKELEEEFNIYMLNRNKKNKKIEKKEIKQIRNEKKGFENFYLKKDLEEIYKLIDFILQKLNNIIEGKEIKNIENINLVKLRNIYNSIIKVKKTTNISKLKEVGELALIKIGKLEKKEVEIKKNKETKELLKETNHLLKKIGSKEQIIENKYNYKKIINDYIYDLKNKIKKFFNNNNNKQKKEKTDFSSYMYIKNQLLLKKYEEKLKLNTKEIFKNLFNKKIREKNFLKRSVIKQNILLLKAKNKGVNFSYTRIKNGYKNIIKNILEFFTKIRVFLFYVIVFYTLSFIVLINIYFYIDKMNLPIKLGYFNYNGLFYFILLLFLYLVLYFSKNLITIIFNIIILFLIIILGIINF